MEIKLYMKEDDGCHFATKVIPDDVKTINLFVANSKQNGIGSLEFMWENDNPNALCRTFSDNIYFQGLTYIMINKKDKFVIKNKNDLIELYQHLSGDDVNTFVKEFKCIEKEHDMNKDF